MGYGGEAPPTGGVITGGDTTGAIIGAIEDHIKKASNWHGYRKYRRNNVKLDKSIVKNTSAKAAVDIAIYDLYGQLYEAPVYKLLGGYRKEIITDITISVNDPDEMAQDSIEAVKQGYKTLKIKVGKDSALDINVWKLLERL